MNTDEKRLEPRKHEGHEEVQRGKFRHDFLCTWSRFQAGIAAFGRSAAGAPTGGLQFLTRDSAGEGTGGTLLQTPF